MFHWRTNNVLCVELIPAELAAVTQIVYDVQADNKTYLIKAYHILLKNKSCLIE